MPLLRLPRAPLAGRPGLLGASAAVLALVTFIVAGWLAWFTHSLTADLPDREALTSLGDMAQSTTIYDADDRPAFTIFKEQRIEVPLDRISPNLVNAVLSVEDQRFYEHSGVDAIRVAAAALRNFREGRRAEGGSTITQQLARQGFLSLDKTYRRKLREVILAGYIESNYEKDEILQMYLNKVYFGDGLYGVEAASRGYFGKSASDVNVPEAALLAGLIQAPSLYAPTINPDRALARRNVVLTTMVASGAIDQENAARARDAEIELSNGLQVDESFGQYFKEHVRRELVDRFGWERVYRGGLRVFTTMDSALQKAAEATLEDGLVAVEKRRGFPHDPRAKQEPIAEGETPDYLQGALVAFDPATGHVRAMVGGRDFRESRFNRATQARRQAGSAFKPFVYAAALENGYTPATLITGLNRPIPTLEGDWVPEDEQSSASAMTLRTALRTSSNRAAVQLLDGVGIPKAVSYVERMNVGTPPKVPSMVLGSGEVTLMAMTAAFGAFANGGIVRQPITIRRVEDRAGEILHEAEDKAARAISESTAFLMSSMLADVINAGTANRARHAGFTLPAAGKTGTTNDYFDAWFVGYTPKLVTGVWVGFDRPRTIVKNGYAGELAVPIWGNFMKVALRGEKGEWFERPSDVVGVNVCRLSGRLANDGCDSVLIQARDGEIQQRSMVYTEFFVRGTQPRTVCTEHERRGFWDRLAGSLSGDGQPVVAAEEGGLPAPLASPTTGAPAPPAVQARPDGRPGQGQPSAEEEPRRRGFWSRVFGRGRDDVRRDEQQRREQEKREQQKKKQQERKPPTKPPGGGA